MAQTLDELITDMELLQNTDIAEELLNAAAQCYAEAWRDSIQSHGHVKTGKLLRNVTVSDPKRDFGNLTKVVYSQGKRPGSKATNAQIAFILHHGRQANGRGRGAIAGDSFVDEAEMRGQQAAAEAVQRKLEELTQKL